MSEIKGIPDNAKGYQRIELLIPRDFYRESQQTFKNLDRILKPLVLMYFLIYLI